MWEIYFKCTRLTIPLAFSVGFIAAIVPQLSTGPFWWNYALGAGEYGCAKTGYLNVLYMNIYQDKFGVEGVGVSFVFYILVVLYKSLNIIFLV